ncbi:MAG: hypothetical protein AWT59_1198 [Candidatus Gallionella acididurans]|uniref:Uncharacterized protein n=1 Tax=Candidatus Gallionella acididurans TaxID=1796491 RepID=A0A139BUN4_9PROT|nr:MAG: hypothetical protein AWT59_1198 [Candidatus Gallionella acididurans]
MPARLIESLRHDHRLTSSAAAPVPLFFRKSFRQLAYRDSQSGTFLAQPFGVRPYYGRMRLLFSGEDSK